MKLYEILLLFGTIFSIINCQLDLYMKARDKNFSVFTNGYLQDEFNSNTFVNQLICTNGMLTIVEFNLTEYNKVIQFHYENEDFSKYDFVISKVDPYDDPYPEIVANTQQNSFILKTNCASTEQTINNQNYYNHITITLKSVYQFSFLINCDSDHRHKKFQIGYLLISLINAIIIIGVALHSRIWSIRFHQVPLRIQLKWQRFLIITIVMLVFGIVIYFYASQQFKTANQVIRYIGIILAFFFTFICCNQILYLFRPFKKILKTFGSGFYKVRLCDVSSIIVSLIIFGISFFAESWIFFNFLAICICVGSIKMFYFDSMKQAFYSLSISVVSVTVTSIIFHFILKRSYNDYATQLSSPLFIEVPDLVNNLYKKCSWLPVIDVIVPGVLLSYLRTYDQNYNTGWGGVYTVVGNLSFIGSTMIWILGQAFYPFSIPFSLITYSLLIASICVCAFKRNELKTLWFGTFNKQNQISSHLLEDETKRSFRKLVENDMIDDLKVRLSVNSQQSQDIQQESGNNRNFTDNVLKSDIKGNRKSHENKKSQQNKQEGGSRFKSNIR